MSQLPNQPQTQQVVKQKTPKKKLIDHLTANGEKFSKSVTLNSLVRRYEAKYPDFIASLNLPKSQINLADTESISGFDPSLDDFPRASDWPKASHEQASASESTKGR